MQSTTAPCTFCYSHFSCLIIAAEVYLNSVYRGAQRLSHNARDVTHGSDTRRHASLTALALADHSQVRLFFAGPHVQLALAVVGDAVAAAHGLVGLHALGWTHALAALGITDRPERAVAAGLVWMDTEDKGLVTAMICVFSE